MQSDVVQLNIRSTRQFRTMLRVLSDRMEVSMSNLVETALVEFVEARLRVDPAFRNTLDPFYKDFIRSWSE